MSTKQQDTRHDGQFISCTQVRPAVEIDCSHWGESQTGSQGAFDCEQATRPARPEDNLFAAPRPVSLVISLQVGPSNDWLQSASQIVSRLNEAELALQGGGGLEWDRVRSAPVGAGRVILTLTPRNREGAEVRLVDLVEWAKKAIPEFAGARLAA